MKASYAVNVPHKHLHSRISYLHQAAAYLTNCELKEFRQKDHESDHLPFDMSQTTVRPTGDSSKRVLTRADIVNWFHDPHKHRIGNGDKAFLQPPPLVRHLVSNIRGVSLKVQAQLSPSLKHSMCKRCDAFLVMGITSTSMVENRSSDGRKPWADVLVVTCNACNSSKRFPIGAKRQHRKTDRQEETFVEDVTPDLLKHRRSQAY